LFSQDHRPTEANWQQEEPVDEVKPFDIPKREVWEAFKKVKANQGAAGVDGQTIADFEADLSNNLYELWNRLSSGSYFPPPVRRVDIPKVDSQYEKSLSAWARMRSWLSD
jgi:retron-type reverse transcriptase